MSQNSSLGSIEKLLEEVRVGILVTVDAEGKPRMRWMTPVFIPRLKGAIYAVTSVESRKAGQIRANPSVSWMFQTPALDRVGTVSGKARLVQDPLLSAEVLEAIGPRLEVFWGYAGNPRNLVVVETEIESAEFFKPRFGSGAGKEA